MHGRVKVRTSEEEKARKEKERKEKLKLYQHAMQKINSKRSSGELDRELLGITGQVLSSNPDIYTLWNIRRETFNILIKTIEASEDLSKLYNDELYLTEYCLKINPKSYCAWHQREWVLTTRSDPDWKKELEICDKYIKLDERNFHTWDYRRFVVGQCKPPLKEEFDFTTEKIHENFSNYSAWHYRSKMLLELYPDLEAGRPIEDSHHKQELELVLNAAFTDPDDTSAWFYQRWLLGAVKDSLQAVNCTIALSKTTVAFNKSVSEDLLKTKIQILFNGEPIDGHWESCTGNQYDNLWIFKHSEEISEDLDIRVEFETENGEKQTIPCHKQKHSKYIGKADIVFQKQYSEPVLAELKKQLVSCRQLLDLEPDSKWTLLTTTIFLHCIDAKQYYKESIANLEKLKIVDKLRSGYYHDLITKWSIEEQLTSSYTQNVDSDLKILFNEKITNLPHVQYYSYCEKVDLSNQNLNSAIFPFLGVLQHCKELNLENNMLSTLKGFPNLSLDIVNLKGNPDLDEEEIRKYAATVQYKVIY